MSELTELETELVEATLFWYENVFRPAKEEAERAAKARGGGPTLVGRIDDFGKSTYEALPVNAPLTPLRGAALAALVAWRKADLTSDEAAIAQNDSFQDMYDVYLEAQHQLRAAADALIAAEGGTG